MPTATYEPIDSPRPRRPVQVSKMDQEVIRTQPVVEEDWRSEEKMKSFTEFDRRRYRSRAPQAREGPFLSKTVDRHQGRVSRPQTSTAHGGFSNALRHLPPVPVA